jgi:hypothetical protein
MIIFITPQKKIDRQIRDNRSSHPSPLEQGGMGLIQHEACVIFSSRAVV